MYDTILGTDGFRKVCDMVPSPKIVSLCTFLIRVSHGEQGMDLYFKRHDGCAVTCDDFLAAMADANGVDLSQFARWYSTSGTPIVKYSSTFDKESGVYQLTLTQSSRSVDPLFIPVAVGLIDKESGAEVVSTKILHLKETTQTFDFPNLQGEVVPSILRNFSAPVKIVSESGKVDEKSLAFLASW